MEQGYTPPSLPTAAPSTENYDGLIEFGLIHSMAEALNERGVTVADACDMSAEDMFDHYLQWNGICGFTSGIIAALDNARAESLI